MLLGKGLDLRKNKLKKTGKPENKWNSIFSSGPWGEESKPPKSRKVSIKYKVPAFWLGLCTFTAEGTGSVPGQGTRGKKNTC